MNMSDPAPRNAFAVLCLLGMVVVMTVALLELSRARRGASLVSPVQLRLRIISALVWMIMLGALSYAIFCLWPDAHDKVQTKRFMLVIAGVVMLLGMGVVLFVFDTILVNRARMKLELELQANRLELARQELLRAGQTQPAVNTAENLTELDYLDAKDVSH